MKEPGILDSEKGVGKDVVIGVWGPDSSQGSYGGRIIIKRWETFLAVQWLESTFQCRVYRSDPCSGTKFPHAMRQLSPRAALTEPAHLSEDPKCLN